MCVCDYDLYVCSCRVLNQRGMSNSEIVSAIKESADGDEEEEEGLYATYAMLHTIRKE